VKRHNNILNEGGKVSNKGWGRGGKNSCGKSAWGGIKGGINQAGKHCRWKWKGTEVNKGEEEGDQRSLRVREVVELWRKRGLGGDKEGKDETRGIGRRGNMVGGRKVQVYIDGGSYHQFPIKRNVFRRLVVVCGRSK